MIGIKVFYVKCNYIKQQKKDKRQVNEKQIRNLEREYRDCEYRDCIKSRRDKIRMYQVLYIVQLPNEEGDMHIIQVN